MMFRSVFAFRPQACVVASLFLAGLLSALSSGNALAGSITYDNTTFTGTLTNFTAVGFQSLPYTDSSNRVISKVSGGNTPFILGGTGLLPQGSVIQFSNFASGTTQFGFYAYTSNTATVASVVFSNGDSYTTPHNIPNGPQFFSFSDTDSFTSATVTFTGLSTAVTDFRTAVTTFSSVPEPSSLALLAAGAMFAGASVWRRRKAS